MKIKTLLRNYGIDLYLTANSANMKIKITDHPDVEPMVIMLQLYLTVAEIPKAKLRIFNGLKIDDKYEPRVCLLNNVVVNKIAHISEYVEPRGPSQPAVQPGRCSGCGMEGQDGMPHVCKLTHSSDR